MRDRLTISEMLAYHGVKLDRPRYGEPSRPYFRGMRVIEDSMLPPFSVILHGYSRRGNPKVVVCDLRKRPVTSDMAQMLADLGDDR